MTKLLPINRCVECYHFEGTTRNDIVCYCKISKDIGDNWWKPIDPITLPHHTIPPRCPLDDFSLYSKIQPPIKMELKHIDKTRLIQ